MSEFDVETLRGKVFFPFDKTKAAFYGEFEHHLDSQHLKKYIRVIDGTQYNQVQGLFTRLQFKSF